MGIVGPSSPGVVIDLVSSRTVMITLFVIELLDITSDNEAAI